MLGTREAKEESTASFPQFLKFSNWGRLLIRKSALKQYDFEVTV